jgi:urease accessory protein
MTIIRQALASPAAHLDRVRLPVERATLAKRRWRGVAESGEEFGFDLESPLADGAVFFQSEIAVYCVAQKYEPVLEIALMPEPRLIAKLGWTIGNLHFPIEVTEAAIRVADDPALRQLFEREAIPFIACKRVFHPLSGGHRH